MDYKTVADESHTQGGVVEVWMYRAGRVPSKALLVGPWIAV